ncbi:MAG: ATP-dependent Clp protease adaptor ClpS, partial [Pseudomonadales bacterium]|nr:ATP-dependent Clp protease adaptor ClpS [Pseudomonadales bacterium]
FTVSWAVPEMFLFAPGTELWRAEKLEPHGFEPHSPVLKDGAGDHQTFEVTLERRANRHLRRVGEPRGSGPWVVQLYNDDTTPFPTVIFALRRVLDVNERTAFEYASLVHSAGIASVRYCRSEWGANRIAARIRAIARRDSFPLTVCVERRL